MRGSTRANMLSAGTKGSTNTAPSTRQVLSRWRQVILMPAARPLTLPAPSARLGAACAAKTSCPNANARDNNRSYKVRPTDALSMAYQAWSKGGLERVWRGSGRGQTGVKRALNPAPLYASLVVFQTFEPPQAGNSHELGPICDFAVRSCLARPLLCRKAVPAMLRNRPASEPLIDNAKIWRDFPSFRTDE